MDEKEVREAIEVIKSNYPTSGYYMLREALDTALEALEKQLPMKPTKVVGAKFIELAECKNCGNELDSELSLGEYCLWCGQRIDWSE